jgi:cytochrome b561
MGKSRNRRYTPTAQTLHWLIALLIVVQFVLASMAQHLPLGVRKLSLLAEHKSVGMAILALAVIRVAWRLTHAPPSLPADMRRIERFLAGASHVSLYAILFLMPLSGWLMCPQRTIR